MQSYCPNFNLLTQPELTLRVTDFEHGFLYMPFYRNGANSETTAAINFIPHRLNNVDNGYAPIENGWAYSTVADFMGQRLRTFIFINWYFTQLTVSPKPLKQTNPNFQAIITNYRVMVLQILNVFGQPWLILRVYNPKS